MEEITFFTEQEKKEFLAKYKFILDKTAEVFEPFEIKTLKAWIKDSITHSMYYRDTNDINPLIRNINTALILIQEVGLKKSVISSVMLYPLVIDNYISIEKIEEVFGNDVSRIISGLIKANSIYAKQAVIENENFRKLLLTFAEDVRVIIIMIADRLALMRMLNHHTNDSFRQEIAKEVSYLYTPLAHRLGLYAIKSELEDTAFKYNNRDLFNDIAKKLNETKSSREKYIAEFIEPVKNKLQETGLNFEIKGRTKSIYSIWNKIKKQNTDIENIYDLFAIRIILDTDREKEKAECWQVYSIITDMFQPNPKRLKDWLSIPKSNGYESLHITVLGPQQRFVEVQIRSKRMDEIAEKGLAAHWKYKGIKGESGLDEWLYNIREVLESGDAAPAELIKAFKMDLYEEEVFVFSLNGDLHKLPKGATVLDFAFMIHTGLGSRCVGALINNKNVRINYELKSGDQIEVLASATQTPKQDWLNFVKTNKARIKIKQSLKEAEHKEAEFGKELLKRRFKNRKIDIDESILMKMMRKLGYKTVTEFYYALASDKLDINNTIDNYLELEKKEKELPESLESRKADNYIAPVPEHDKVNEDILVIDQDLTGIEYKFAKCCNPIYGDEVFGFISTQGGIKIHKADCKNAPQMISRFGYRIVMAKWSGKAGSQYPITLRVIGHDDIGIVTNITSIISKEKNITLRSISIDSNDGLFHGHITVMASDSSGLDALIKKLKTVKGVKKVERMTLY